MAYDKPLFMHSRKAGADLSALQYTFVKLDSSGNAVGCSGTTDKPYGILQNAPTSGQDAEVMLAGISKLVLVGTPAVDALIGTDAAGKGAAYVPGTDTTKYLCARYIGTAAGAAGDIGSVLVNTLSLTRGA